jgi:starch synthase
MLLLAHPSGNTFFRAAAHAFYVRGWLQELHSCICWDPHSPLSRILIPSLARQFARRSFAEVPLSLQHNHPWRELARLAAPRSLITTLHRHESGPLSVDAVYRSFDRHVAARLADLPALRAVYAYEDAAMNTFVAARARGLHCAYDLPIGHWRSAQRIFAEERDLQPEWACTLSGLGDSAAKLARKDEELSLADAVIVPSNFVRTTLTEQPITHAPIHVVPFGAPPPLPQPPPTPSSGPLRLLYVGSLGQRKGLAYALEAVADLGSQVSLTLIGRPTSPHCAPLNSALEQHRWIPTLPHAQVLEEMRQHDVLILPSLFEGFALVIHEALSQGLPVIATANTGACESVRDGVEGFIVPIRSSEAIAACLQRLVDNRELLSAMRMACLRRAGERSWHGYEQALSAVLTPWLSAEAPAA